MRYSIEPIDRIFVKGYGFLFFTKYMNKDTGKTISKRWGVNTARNFLNILNNLLQMHLKLFQKEQFKKKEKQLVIFFAIKLLLKL